MFFMKLEFLMQLERMFVILISQEQDDIPFDLKHIRTIFYKNTPRGAEEFTKKLIATIQNIISGTELNEMKIEQFGLHKVKDPEIA